MNRKSTLVCVNNLGRECAVAKVIDMQHQIIISFLEKNGAHVTLHSQNNEPKILMTYHSKNKSPTKSDPIKIDIAKHCGWKNPNRHAKYYVHQELVTESLKIPFISFNRHNSDIGKCMLPFMVIPISYIECRYPLPKKYSKLPRVTFIPSSCEFRLFMYFTKNKSKFDGKILKSIETCSGYVLLAVR